MSIQTAVRLPDELYHRLKRLSDETGRTATYYIREAIEDHLGDLEDAYFAQRVLERVRSGEEKTYSLDEVKKELGLDD
ncbi:MAG: ribbon-helix-helix domain-containing protein [Gammaproteobacteria bacterium]|jgi:RHH-type rel operon transcriptional repressor/antitoxin RelB|nr:ribbon-helix-helix domain-containing protein [Gammaproteobacteria bacterium]